MSEGLAVLIPERGTPEVLALTLQHLRAALARLPVVHAVCVYVNGAPPREYAALVHEHPFARFVFDPRARGFHGAIERGLRHVNQPWVYLLNSDMRLAPEALLTLLEWRAPDVFAIASQIFLSDPSRRREETGFTGPVRRDAQLELHDLLPPDDCVRGHLYAGGGASLFQTAALRAVLGASAGYAPFYFEDADWAMQAAARGLRVLFQPRSHATHLHRATIAQHYAPTAIDAIVARNLNHFRWRYADQFDAARTADAAFDWRRALGIAHHRARAAVKRSACAPSFLDVAQQRYPSPPRAPSGRPRVLLVSPFAVLPPAHGGARRSLELARASAAEIDWLLLHDEAPAAAQPATADDAPFVEIHPVGGRRADDGSRADRWSAHAHPRLKRALRHLVATRAIDAVLFEHLECAQLIDALPSTLPLLWHLHDVGRALDPAGRAAVCARLARVDTLLLSTAQDLGWWPHPKPRLIENGISVPAIPLARSPLDGPLLMVAPLRYAPNLIGFKAFLEQAWRALRRTHPRLELTVLGGVGAARHWGTAALPRGVELIDGYRDPTPHYAAASLCLNPQIEIEGAALKIGEALGHGRMMISTLAGARGFEAVAIDALQRVVDVAAMAPAVQRWLSDGPARHAAERGAIDALPEWRWARRVRPLIDAVSALKRR